MERYESFIPDARESYEREIQDMTKLIELVIEDQTFAQTALEGQASQLQENHRKLVSGFRSQNAGMLLKGVRMFGKSVDRERLRLVIQSWRLCTQWASER